jgi:hypothetical protein
LSAAKCNIEARREQRGREDGGRTVKEKGQHVAKVSHSLVRHLVIDVFNQPPPCLREAVLQRPAAPQDVTDLVEPSGNGAPHGGASIERQRSEDFPQTAGALKLGRANRMEDAGEIVRAQCPHDGEAAPAHGRIRLQQGRRSHLDDRGAAR